MHNYYFTAWIHVDTYSLCIPCKLKGVEDYVELEKLIPELPDKEENDPYEILKTGEIPDEGFVVNLHSKRMMLKKFRKIQRKG